MKIKEDLLWKIHAQGNLINLPFWNRIKHLSQNPNLCKEAAGDGPCGEPVLPNCHGTVVYLLGKEDFIEGSSMEKCVVNSLMWVLKEGGPGYVDQNLMKKILEKHFVEVKFPRKGDVVSFWEDNRLVHSAVFSEFLGWRIVIFHQRDYGEGFEISSVEDYLSGTSKYFEKYYSLTA